MDKIIVRNLLLRGIVGIKPDERANRQDILINLTLYGDIRPAALSDDIADAINYRSITKRIIEHVEASADYLVERLITDVAHLILAEFPAVHKAVVRLEKPGALRFAESVGMEIERTRADFPDLAQG